MKKSTSGGQDPPRPHRVQVGSVIAYPKRPPIPSDPRWYWQVVRHFDDQQHTVQGESGRYTDVEVLQRLAALVQEHGWDVPVKKPPPPSIAPTIAALLLDWLTEQETRLKVRKSISTYTYSTYLYQVTVMIRYAGTRHPSEYTTRSTLQALCDELAGDYTARTITGLMGALRQAWSWGLEEKLVEGLLPRIEPPRVSRETYHVNRYTPSAPETWAMAARLVKPWQYVAVALLLATGARRSEIGTLVWERVDLKRGEVRVTGKTGARSIPVPSWMVELLKVWRPETKRVGLVLGVSVKTVRGRLGTAMAAAAVLGSVPPFSPHALRRRKSWELISRGTDPATYQELMGHTLDEGLRDYARSTPQARRAALDAQDDPPPEGGGPLYTGPVH